MSLLAVFITLTFEDAKGKTSRTSVKVPVGFSIPEYVDAAQRIATSLIANTEALLTDVTVCLGLNITTSQAAAAGADVQEKAQFVFDTANSMTHVVYWPTLDESVVLANSDALDEANVDVAAFIDAMVNGITLVDTTNVQPVNARDDDITSLTYAREYFRRR